MPYPEVIGLIESALCPVCNCHIFARKGWKGDGKRSIFVYCELDRKHIKAFINRWHESKEYVDFNDWKFIEGQMQCPVCHGGLAIADFKSGKPGYDIRCKSDPEHFHGWMNRPDQIQWFDFSDPVEDE